MNRRVNDRKKTPPVTQADYELLAGFRRALRDFLHFSEEAATAAGVTPQQHQAMLVIKGLINDNSPTVGELATSLKIRHQSAVGLVNRMTQRRLVRKRIGVKDHREVLVQLTASGEKLLEKLSAAHKAEIGRIGPVLQTTLAKLNSFS